MHKPLDTLGTTKNQGCSLVDYKMDLHLCEGLFNMFRLSKQPEHKEHDAAEEVEKHHQNYNA